MIIEHNFKKQLLFINTFYKPRHTDKIMLWAELDRTWYFRNTGGQGRSRRETANQYSAVLSAHSLVYIGTSAKTKPAPTGQLSTDHLKVWQTQLNMNKCIILTRFSSWAQTVEFNQGKINRDRN